jgi:hypothetical protein
MGINNAAGDISPFKCSLFNGDISNSDAALSNGRAGTRVTEASCSAVDLTAYNNHEKPHSVLSVVRSVQVGMLSPPEYKTEASGPLHQKHGGRKHEVRMMNGVFWDATPCGSCKNRRFGGT